MKHLSTEVKSTAKQLAHSF